MTKLINNLNHTSQLSNWTSSTRYVSMPSVFGTILLHISMSLVFELKINKCVLLTIKACISVCGIYQHPIISDIN
jgi:hypothetical protein